MHEIIAVACGGLAIALTLGLALCVHEHARRTQRQRQAHQEMATYQQAWQQRHPSDADAAAPSLVGKPCDISRIYAELEAAEEAALTRGERG